MAAAPTPIPTTEPSVPWPEVERFISLFTHDVRNGLNAIELQLTLLGEISDDPGVKDEVKQIRATVVGITRQLQSVRAAAGVPSPHLFVYPAVDFVEDLRERFERQHPDDSARVRWQIEPGNQALSVDPELSMSALLELLKNAIFFAVADSTIEVHASTGANGLTLVIRQTAGDAPTGSPDDWARTPLSSSRRDGYGLGAFRARRIIEAQKGALRFDYSEKGQSVVTTVILPPAAVGD